MAVLAGVVVNVLTRGGAGALTAKQLVDVPTDHATNGIDPSAWVPPHLPGLLSHWRQRNLILGVTIAVVASLETLLCVEAT